MANRCKGRLSNHTIMANQGFGPVKVVQEGVKQVSYAELFTMTIEEAMESHRRGLAVTTA